MDSAILEEKSRLEHAKLMFTSFQHIHLLRMRRHGGKNCDPEGEITKIVRKKKVLSVETTRTAPSESSRQMSKSFLAPNSRSGALIGGDCGAKHNSGDTQDNDPFM